MLTLSVMVLVFLVGHWLGFRKAQAQTRKEFQPIIDGIDVVHAALIDHHHPCPICGAPAFGPEPSRVCMSCLAMAKSFKVRR